MNTELEKVYQVKAQIPRPNGNQVRELKSLNRIVARDNHKGICYEVDPRHTEIIIEQFGLREAKGVATPGAKEEGHIHKKTETSH